MNFEEEKKDKYNEVKISYIVREIDRKLWREY